ncbi:MAG: hypothetical protein ACR2KL_04925, partial [Nocardioidaceae bacterium]
MRVLTDDDVRAASAATVVAAAREALLQAGRGELAASPRTRGEAGTVEYVSPLAVSRTAQADSAPTGPAIRPGISWWLC